MTKFRKSFHAIQVCLHGYFTFQKRIVTTFTYLSWLSRSAFLIDVGSIICFLWFPILPLKFEYKCHKSKVDIAECHLWVLLQVIWNLGLWESMDWLYYKSGRFLSFLILSYLFFFIIKVIALCFFVFLLSFFFNFLFLIIDVIMQKLLPLITFSRAMVCEFLQVLCYCV